MSVKVTFREDRETKGTFRFAEELAGELDEAKIGTLYVRKGTLKELGWTSGRPLAVTVEAA